MVAEEDTVIGQNNIVYDNYATIDPNINGTVLFTYSCVEGGLSGTGNIDEDPLFVTGPDGDYYLSQTAAGQPTTSPCVDAGDPASAMITGTTRTDGIQDEGIVDMGYHFAVMENPPPPDLSVTLTPYGTPIQIPATGGTFDYNIAITNNDPGSQTFDGWCDGFIPIMAMQEFIPTWFGRRIVSPLKNWKISRVWFKLSGTTGARDSEMKRRGHPNRCPRSSHYTELTPIPLIR